MKKYSLAVLLTLISVNALANEKFSGPYVGVQLGYIDSKNNGNEVEGPTGQNPNESAVNTSLNGLAYGLNAGFNQVLDNKILVGIEADIEKRNASDTKQAIVRGFPDQGSTMKSEFSYGSSLRGRLGIVINHDATLLYATGGVAMAKMKSTLYFDDGVTTVQDQQSDNLVGWTAGLGAEHSFTENISAKAEYRYTDYGTLNLKATNYAGNGFYERQNVTENSFRIGLNYHF